MAKIETTPVAGENYRTFDSPSTITTVVGVVLSTRIPSGSYSSGLGAGDEEGDIKIRPTNVTATIGSDHDIDPDYILLHNGVNGGFSQQLLLEASETYRVNSVVKAVITNS